MAPCQYYMITIGQNIVKKSTNDSPRTVIIDGFANKLRSSSLKIHLYIPASLYFDLGT